MYSFKTHVIIGIALVIVMWEFFSEYFLYSARRTACGLFLSWYNLACKNKHLLHLKRKVDCKWSIIILPNLVSYMYCRFNWTSQQRTPWGRITGRCCKRWWYEREGIGAFLFSCAAPHAPPLLLVRSRSVLTEREKQTASRLAVVEIGGAC